MSWGTYPFVYISENGGLAGNKATLYEQAGFSLAGGSLRGRRADIVLPGIPCTGTGGILR